MSNFTKKVLRNLRDKIRSTKLEIGESGLGKPAPSPPRVKGASADRAFRVAVVGAGNQGIAQCIGLKSIKGVELAGLADVNAAKLDAASERLRLARTACFSDASKMLEELGAVDLFSVATTSPYHVALGRLALQAGVKRILLEKPIDNSLAAAKAFQKEASGEGAAVWVNHSRRWMLDYRAVKRCIDRGMIGCPRSITITIGKGELAMHASHYFDLCRYIFNSDAAWGRGFLEPIKTPNQRGAEYEDPSGYCLFTFQNGARAFVDFSSDLSDKDPIVTIKGTTGKIVVDEYNWFWTVQDLAHRVWKVPFTETMKSSVVLPRVVCSILSDETEGCSVQDGIAALEMVVAAHLSHRAGGTPVHLPLSEHEYDLGLTFP